MKRKLLLLTLAAAMLCALAAPAFADMIWEPDNGFYASHRDECSYVSRGYLTNGEKGYVTLREAPDSLAEVINVPNGEVVQAAFAWSARDGAQWLMGSWAEDLPDGGYRHLEGWYRESEVALLYDGICFAEDHGAEFTDYDGSGDGLTKVCLYSYPGGRYSHDLKEQRDYMTFADSFQDLYTDEQGRRWSYIGYYMGHQDAWACLDDPLNENLGTDKPLAAFQVRNGGALTPAADPELPATMNQNGGAQSAPAEPAPAIIPPADNIPAAKTGTFWALPAALVVLAAAGAALLVRVRRKGGPS